MPVEYEGRQARVIIDRAVQSVTVVQTEIAKAMQSFSPPRIVIDQHRIACIHTENGTRASRPPRYPPISSSAAPPRASEEGRLAASVANGD